MLKFRKGEIIRYIAFTSMFIDHISMIGGYLPGRIFGRLAAPCFIWLAGRGTERTKDKQSYIERLILWGLITEFVIDDVLINYFKLSYLKLADFNILFSLSLGVIAAIIKNWIDSKCCNLLGFKLILFSWTPVVLIGTLAYSAGFDYGLITVLGVAIFSNWNQWLIIPKNKEQWKSSGLPLWILWATGCLISLRGINLLAVFVPFLLEPLENLEGPRLPRTIWYALFPIHFIIIKLLFLHLA